MRVSLDGRSNPVHIQKVGLLRQPSHLPELPGYSVCHHQGLAKRRRERYVQGCIQQSRAHEFSDPFGRNLRIHVVSQGEASIPKDLLTVIARTHHGQRGPASSRAAWIRSNTFHIGRGPQDRYPHGEGSSFPAKEKAWNGSGSCGNRPSEANPRLSRQPSGCLYVVAAANSHQCARHEAAVYCIRPPPGAENRRGFNEARWYVHHSTLPRHRPSFSCRIPLCAQPRMWRTSGNRKSRPCPQREPYNGRRSEQGRDQWN